MRQPASLGGIHYDEGETQVMTSMSIGQAASITLAQAIAHRQQYDVGTITGCFAHHLLRFLLQEELNVTALKLLEE